MTSAKQITPHAHRPFSFPVRVYYEDTDTAGVVYYAGYLRFLERGRTEWLRSLGVEQPKIATELGVAFAVRSLNIEYLKPARLDELLTIVTHVESMGRAQIMFGQRVEREGELLVEATVRIVSLNLHSMKATALPKNIRALME